MAAPVLLSNPISIMNDCLKVNPTKQGGVECVLEVVAELFISYKIQFMIRSRAEAQVSSGGQRDHFPDGDCRRY